MRNFKFLVDWTEIIVDICGNIKNYIYMTVSERGVDSSGCEQWRALVDIL